MSSQPTTATKDIILERAGIEEGLIDLFQHFRRSWGPSDLPYCPDAKVVIPYVVYEDWANRIAHKGMKMLIFAGMAARIEGHSQPSIRHLDLVETLIESGGRLAPEPIPPKEPLPNWKPLQETQGEDRPWLTRRGRGNSRKTVACKTCKFCKN